MSDLKPLLWPVSRLGEAMEALASQSGLSPRMVKPPLPLQDLEQGSDETLSRWLALAAGCLGLEVEAVDDARIPKSSGSCAVPVRPSSAFQARGNRASWPCSGVGGRWPPWGLIAKDIRCSHLSSARYCAETSKPHCWQKSIACSTRLAWRRGAEAEHAQPSCASNSVPPGSRAVGSCACSRNVSLLAAGTQWTLPQRLLALVGCIPCSTSCGCSPGGCMGRGCPAGALRYRKHHGLGPALAHPNPMSSASDLVAGPARHQRWKAP